MVHIYGHSWPVRWGKAGEKRNVHVYSNCDSAELFMNGVSMGVKRRDSQDFPAAGLRWSVTFGSGKNTLRAVATKGGVKTSDEISLTYQTDPWGKPAELRLQEKARKDNLVTFEATLFDAQGVLCLDSSVFIHFSLVGAGRLIDNMGTASDSRELQLSNGRAQISLVHNGGCRFEARCEGLPAATLNL
jgi:beta-galactosidase